MNVVKRKKVLAIASIGGHWVQLLRITKSLEDKFDFIYLSSNSKSKTLIDKPFYSINDFSRWNMWKMIPSIFKIFKIISKEQPNVIISTGAAPGLLALLIAKYLFRKKTIWVDSIANVEQLSACGRFATKLGIDSIYTQWEHLANDKIHFSGNVLG